MMMMVTLVILVAFWQCLVSMIIAAGSSLSLSSSSSLSFSSFFFPAGVSYVEGGRRKGDEGKGRGDGMMKRGAKKRRVKGAVGGVVGVLGAVGDVCGEGVAKKKKRKKIVMMMPRPTSTLTQVPTTTTQIPPLSTLPLLHTHILFLPCISRPILLHSFLNKRQGPKERGEKSLRNGV